MSTTGQKIKAALSALETARRALNACDEDHTEIDGIQNLLASLREEQAETERQLAMTREQMVKDGAFHSDMQKKHAEEQERAHDKTEKLRDQLRTLERQIKTAQEKHDNVVAALSALTQRLKV
jgi:predicted  nucleic acid-binding Zn-ribbon protein